MDSPARPDDAAPTRACVEVAVPPGPSGLDVLMPALTAALEGSGPAIALTPGGGPDRYRARIRAAVRPGEPVPAGVAVVVATSGSTGAPAGVLLGADALRAAAGGFAERSGAPSGHRWVAALPLHHAGGLMVAVRSAVAGTAPVGLASLGGAATFSAEAFAAATREAVRRRAVDARPLAVSLVPPMLAVLAEAPEGPGLLAEYDAVLVGGAAAPTALMGRLSAAGVRLLASYGMSETCGGAVFDGRPLPGTRVDADPTGRLVVCGRQVAHGYRGSRNADRWSTGPAGTRCFRTEDLGLVGADGRVVVTGRTDDQVQVGGAAVSLDAVRALLHSDERVAAAEVLALPDPRWGARLVAFVVPSRTGRALDPGALGEALARTAQDALGRPARPRTVRIVAALPLGASGKVDAAALAALAGQRPDGVRP